ncbi:glycosyltransferase [Streptomyces sp. NBC_01186]|uniref:glycosyltransferase n=1 Tax=Streptomyces sp. NBC_01186 TaxID=2903765 RepID=UPI002E1071AC|nr:glycosyltransferase [Streptomyces sp. NBC_01186]
MKILIAAAGSYGDIAPYTGLGARLREAGHEVAVTAHDTHTALIRNAGLEPRPLPADPRGHGAANLRAAAAFLKDLAPGLIRATEADAPDLLLLSTTTAPLGAHLAEALGVPALGVPLQPTEPTGDFAPPAGGARSLGRRGNLWAGRLSQRVVDRLYREPVRLLRAGLGLPPLTARDVRRRRRAADGPVVHGFSPALLARPADWRPGLTVAGNWWPHLPPDARLPAGLADFLASGPPPVFVGFGSMSAGERGGERLGSVVVRALRRAGVRGVLQEGAAGLSPGEHLADGDMLAVGQVPHELLFPHLAAVVHHAGAGTTAAALRAGVPAVPVPVTADQPFWAARLAAVGAGTPPVPFAALSGADVDAVDRLAAPVERAAQDPALRAAAARVARRMAGEDGAAEVLRQAESLAERPPAT